MKVLRQHLMIRADLNAVGSSFDTNINLQFIPDEVIVWEVVYNPSNTENGTFFIRLRLLNDGSNGVLCFFNFSRNDASGIYQCSVNTPNSVFNLVNFMNNINYNFTIFKSVGSVALTGELLLHLEFVKRTK